MDPFLASRMCSDDLGEHGVNKKRTRLGSLQSFVPFYVRGRGSSDTGLGGRGTRVLRRRSGLKEEVLWFLAAP